ncbi:DUF1972 domain-containing protein [Candidatus Nanopelagicales bacterium]|nr:DUF1972 domain-containing protein [Candidatus Nanopelagicales bacterium]
MKVAIMGTRGVPASYGGFETAVEEVGKRLAARGHDVTVYCRNPGQALTEYQGMRLVNLPALRHRMTETLSHTALSSSHAIIKDRPDVALVLNAGNAPLLTPLKAAGVPTAIHLDGLESKREKWRGAGARYYKWAERVAVKNGNEVIADSHAIASYVQQIYGREATVIAYGADVIAPGSRRLQEIGVIRRDYHLIVARLEPENHVLEAVHGYSISEETRPLLVVGSAPYSQWYIDRVNEIAAKSPGVRMLGGIYDQELLNQLYANARTYIHGHSVGGTNPSLLRAMGAGAPVLAFDCEFNREVTAEKAFFWTDAESLATILDEVAEGEVDAELAAFSELGKERIASAYQWEAVTDQYEQLIQRLAQRRPSQARESRAGKVKP